MTRRTFAWSMLLVLATLARHGGTATSHADERLEFFEKKIRPALVQHCTRCHGAQADEPQGGLRLDLQAGWQQGGDSGQPAIVPGDPNASPLIRAIQHADGVSAMPPKQPRLPDAVVADFVTWVQAGAVDQAGDQHADV